jgi:hypothetical protein
METSVDEDERNWHFRNWKPSSINSTIACHLTRTGDVIVYVDDYGAHNQGVVDFTYSGDGRKIIRVNQEMIAIENGSDSWLLREDVKHVINCTVSNREAHNV